MKIAVIGSGAAAHAVLGVIARQRPDAEVDVYDAPAQQSAAPTTLRAAPQERILSDIRWQLSFAIVSPSTSEFLLPGQSP